MANHSERFAALSDPTRREIFERLTKKAMAVGEIVEDDDVITFCC